MTDPKKDAAQLVLPLIQRFVGTQPDALTQMREQVDRELEFHEATVMRLRRELDAIDLLLGMIEDDEATPVELPPTAARVRKPLRRAIMDTLATRPGYWSRDELLAELTRAGNRPGGKNPRNVLISRLAEMANEGLIARMDNGFGIPEESEVPAV